MQEHFQSDSASWFAVVAPTASKLVAAWAGAAIMVAIDPPESKRELFWRLVAAGACSIYFGDLAIDVLHSWWHVIDPLKHTHRSAVDFLVGACGWFVFGGLVMWLKKLRADPIKAIADAKKDLA